MDGGTEVQALDVHPYALLVPAMTDEDEARLRDDIKLNGVNEPLVMFEGKVLDGRNRLRIASAGGAVVRLAQFSGTPEEARAYVWSSNVARRHLSVPQLALAASRFGFIAQAKQRDGAHWPRAVSRQVGGAVSPATLRRFDQGRVADAPKTVTRIESGEVRRVDVAVKSAAAELGVAVPPTVARTAYDRLGCARGDALAAERAVLNGEPIDPVAFATRAREIQGALLRVDKVLRARVTGNRPA
jgi:hypothetical protein